VRATDQGILETTEGVRLQVSFGDADQFVADHFIRCLRPVLP
jgi:hypothetical protein